MGCISSDLCLRLQALTHKEWVCRWVGVKKVVGEKIVAVG